MKNTLSSSLKMYVLSKQRQKKFGYCYSLTTGGHTLYKEHILHWLLTSPAEQPMHKLHGGRWDAVENSAHHCTA